MKTFKIISTGVWQDIDSGQEVYVYYKGNKAGLYNKLNENSQFSGANSVELVKGNYPIHQELSSWLN